MRAGKMDREITIEAYTRTGTTPGGAPIMTWATFATVRAQLIQSSIEEYQRAYGEGANTAVIFRIRWLEGVTVEHRIRYAPETYLNIREIKEIGRRKGMELRCEEVRT